jgi:transmembrane sensor
MNDSLAPDGIDLTRYREASEWLLRLNGPSPSEQEVEQWLCWCEAHGDNLAAFEKLQRDWQDTEGLKTAPELLSGAQRVGMTRRHPRILSGWTAQARNSRAAQWVIAASLLAAVVLGYQQWTRRVSDHEIISTSNQEPTTLPDGSSLLLSAKASADVDFSGTTRHIALHPGGEAYIKVHHDKTRPFTVRAGTMTVTAVGTAFDVRREPNRVTVTVEEGTILASAVGPSGSTQWRAGAGYQVEYLEDSRTAVVARVDTEKALGWRDGELAYDDAPFESVIADINRYSTVSVVVRDPKLLELRFTGTVFVASVKDWIRAVEAKYPVHAVMSPGGDITLQSAAGGDVSAKQ